MQASERDPQGLVNIEWRGSNTRKMLVSPEPSDLKLDRITAGLLGELMPPDGSLQDIRSDIYKAWYSLVEEYSGRLLTYPDKDKLVALSSIAKTYHHRYSQILGPEDSYISGLWKGDLVRGLSFRYGTGTKRREELGLPQVTKCNLEDPSTWEYRPPSFSWTRGDGGVTWSIEEMIGHNIPEYDVEVLDVHNITTGGNCWGLSESCWIVLRGVVSSVEMLHAVEGNELGPDDDVQDLEFLRRTSYIRLSVVLEPEGRYKQRWLMIYPVGETHEYRRVGVASTFGDFSLDWTHKTNIKLI